MPGWIIEYFLEEYSEAETEQILQGFMQKESGVTVRCNLNLQNPSGNPDLAVPEIIESLERQQVKVQPGKWFPYALHLSGFERVDSMEAFARGRLQVQDESSMLVGAVSGIKPGQEVLDVCAAPGGKSLHAADLLAGTGVIFSCDLSETKVHLIQENMERAGVDHCELYRQNARILRKDWIDSVDVLIADLPCSGLGVIGRKKDIKYKMTVEKEAELVALQREILKNAVRYVKPGGTLLYSTCTIHKAENEENVRWLSEQYPELEVELQKQIFPGEEGNDGFFVARMKKGKKHE